MFTWTSVAICGKLRKKQNQQIFTKINNRSKDLSKPIETPWNILDWCQIHGICVSLHFSSKNNILTYRSRWFTQECEPYIQ